MKRLFVLLLAIVSATPALSITLSGDDWKLLDHEAKGYRLLEQSSLHIVDGAEVKTIRAYEQSQVDMWAGSIRHFVVGGNAELAIRGGSVKRLKARDSSVVSLSDLSQLKRLVLSGNTSVNLYANDLDYDGKWLSGAWLNGDDFRIRVVNKTDQHLKELLRIHSSYSPIKAPSSEVPVPASSVLFASALIGMGLMARKRSVKAH